MLGEKTHSNKHTPSRYITQEILVHAPSSQITFPLFIVAKFSIFYTIQIALVALKLKSFSGCVGFENIFPHEKSFKMLPENANTCPQISNFVRVTSTFFSNSNIPFFFPYRPLHVSIPSGLVLTSLSRTPFLSLSTQRLHKWNSHTQLLGKADKDK